MITTQTLPFLGRLRATDPRRRFALAAIVFSLLSVAFLVFVGFNIGGTTLEGRFDEILEAVAAAIATGTCLWRSRRERSRTRSAWTLIGAAAASWCVGGLIWCWYDIVANHSLPFPSVADVFFLLAVPLLIVGVLRFPSVPVRTVSSVRQFLDGLIVAVSLLVVVTWPVLGPVYRSHPGLLARIVSLAYPTSDVVVLTIVLGIVTRRGPWRVSQALIAGGVLGIACSDAAFVYRSGAHATSIMPDIGWIVGFFLVALASMWPGAVGSRQSASHWLGRTQIVLPVALLAVAAIVGGASAGLDHNIDHLLLVLGSVLVGVVLVRQMLVLLENVELTHRLELAIERLRRDEDRLNYQTLHDVLTGVGNRALFARRLEESLERTEGGRQKTAVLFCDIDDLKSINDSLGHSYGDEMLISVAQRLRGSLRENDTVARIGDDEFAVVLDGTSSHAEIAQIAERVQLAMVHPVALGSKEIRPSLSIGIAIPDHATTSYEEVLRIADVALGATKAAGGNGYRFYDPGLGAEMRERLELRRDFADALREGQFFLEYQPILDVRTAQPVGAEALIRWHHPERGLLMPGAFLDVAEQSGAIASIGQWVLNAALEQLRDWHARLPKASELFMSVNLSVRQLEGGDIVATTASALADSGVDPGSLRLEITESALMNQAQETIDILAGIRSLGVSLEVDDFGTGYSSLRYLKNLPIDALKVDQSFVSGLGADARDRLIVETIVNLAHGLSIEVIAEGIETSEQLNELRSLGCEHGQGFLYSPSLGAERFETWLETWKSEEQTPTFR